MKRARIYHAGRAIWGTMVHDDRAIRLATGEIVPVESVTWLPPITEGATIFAVGLNYIDHSAELGFKAPSEPLIFLKGHGTLVGHGGHSPLPASASQMHPECELVAVMGKPARRVKAVDALAYVGGYTIACDYAIRDYLENYYRPNLRVKNRDATTPLGPWIVDADEIPDPQSLALSTTVNGSSVQSGSTTDMVFSVAALVEHISEFMTLMPGDMILTGTPHGVHFVSGGDAVTCEVAGVGRLVHHVKDVP